MQQLQKWQAQFVDYIKSNPTYITREQVLYAAYKAGFTLTRPSEFSLYLMRYYGLPFLKSPIARFDDSYTLLQERHASYVKDQNAFMNQRKRSFMEDRQAQQAATKETLVKGTPVIPDCSNLIGGYLQPTSSTVAKNFVQIRDEVVKLLAPLEAYATFAEDRALAKSLLADILVQQNLNPASVNLQVRNFLTRNSTAVISDRLQEVIDLMLGNSDVFGIPRKKNLEKSVSSVSGTFFKQDEKVKTGAGLVAAEDAPTLPLLSLSLDLKGSELTRAATLPLTQPLPQDEASGLGSDSLGSATP